MADQTFAVHCGFFDAIDSDRTYSADEMNRPYRRVISNGVFATPQGNPSTDLQVVESTGMNIICKAGEGLFADKWFENPSSIVITVPNNTATVPRIDSVLVQVDTRTSGRVGNIVHRTGTPASSPTPPAINQTEGVVEYRLANIMVNPGVTSIMGRYVTDRRGSSDCPWVTSLIYQVDTSTLYDQWAAAYEEYFEQEKAIWDSWYAQLTEDLDVSMTLDRHVNTVTTTAQTTGTIPIGLAYNHNTDILEVYINGLRAIEGTHYVVVDGDTSIMVENQLDIGQTVTFVVMRSVISGSATSIMTILQALEEKIAGIAGGTPTVVDSTSAMTDTEKIYILSTDGKWYYYSATQEDWVIGGTYGGVPTDPTLTQEGMAADAKAVGDALDNVTIEVDATLTQEGMAADAKIVGDQLSNLKEGLTDITGDELIEWTIGHYYMTAGNAGTVQDMEMRTSASYKCALYDCTAGDHFVISGTGGVGAKLYAFYDSDNKLITSSGSSATLNNAVIVAPETSAKVSFNVGIDESRLSYLLGQSGSLLKDEVKQIGRLEESAVPTVFENTFINYKNVDTASNDYVCTDYVRVAGSADKVSIKCTLFNRNTALLFYGFDKSLIAFIDSSNASEYGITANSNTPKTVDVVMPSGTVYIRANMRNTYYTQPSDFAIVFTNTRTLRETEKDSDYNLVNLRQDYESFRLKNLRSKFDGRFNWIAYSNVQGSGMSINTLEHFEWVASKEVFSSIKADMQLTSDGQIILCHDDGFTLNSNGKVTTFDANNCTLIHDMTYDECIALQHAGTDQHVCGIDAVLKTCKKSGKHLYITLRDNYYQDTFDALLPKLRQYSMESETIINCYPQNNAKCNYVRSKSEDICICYTCSANVNQFANAVDTCIALGNCIIAPFTFNGGTVNIIDTLAPIQSSINKAKANGLRVYVAIMYQDNATDALMECGITGGQTYIMPTDM